MIQFQGDLELISFSDVLQFLAGGRKSGALVVEREDGVTRQVFFEKGDIIAASSSRVEDYLGQILIRRGVVPDNAIEEAIRDKPQGMRLGAALVSRGRLTEADLEHFLSEQFRKIIFDTFSWSKGAFRFVTGLKPEGGRVAHSMSADNFVLEGLRRMDEGRIINAALPPEDTPLVTVDGVDAKPKMTQLEIRVMERLRDGGTRGDLMRTLRFDEFDLNKAVFRLYEAGVIETRSEMPEATEEGEGRLRQDLTDMVASYNSIFTLIYQSVMLESGREAEAPLAQFLRKHPPDQFPLLKDLNPQPDGGVQADILLKNLEEAVPMEKRRRALAETLSQMLSVQLGVVREKAGPDVATGILEMCSTLLR